MKNIARNKDGASAQPSRRYLCGVYDEIGIVAQQITAEFGDEEVLRFADLGAYGKSVTYKPFRSRPYQRQIDSSRIQDEVGKKDYFINSCNFIVVKVEPTSAQSHSLYTGAVRALLDGRIEGLLAISYAISMGFPPPEQIIELADAEERTKLCDARAKGTLVISSEFLMDKLKELVK